MRRSVRQLLIITCVLSVAAGCTRRQRLSFAPRDAAPVVVVERPAALPLDNLSFIDEREPNDDLAHAQPWELGKGVSGAIGPVAGDIDIYRLRVEGGGAKVTLPDGGIARQVARIELGGENGLVLELIDNSGARLALASPQARLVIPNYAVEVGKDYFVRVSAEKPTIMRLPYQLSVSLAPPETGEEIEPNNKMEQISQLAATDATGYWGALGDVDWLRLGGQASAGATLKIELSGVDDVGFSLRIVDEQGKAIVTTRGAAGGSVALRNAPWQEGGTRLQLRAESAFNTSQRWVLHGTIEPFVDGMEVEPNDTVAAAQQLAWVDGVAQVQGYLWPGDVDMYLLHADNPGVLQVDLDPPTAGKVDLRLEISAGSGKGQARLKVDDGGSAKAEAIRNWYLSANSDVLLRVAARGGATLFDAPYRLACKLGAPDGVEHEPNGNRPSATPLVAGSPMQGAITPRGDEDWYRMEAPAGTSSVAVTLEDVPPGMTPQLRVVDQKKTVAQAAGTSLATVLRGPIFWIVVRDSAGKSTPQGSYRLQARFE